jgi:RNA polymerase sigma-B factor
MSHQGLATGVSRAERSSRTAALYVELQATDDADERTELLDRIIVLNLGVAEAVASRYRGRGVEDDDLRQAAYEGLSKAVQKFDPAVRPDLLTYAVPTIRGEVQRWFRDRSWMVRPPRRLQELQWQVNRSEERLSASLGRRPTDEELSADVDCTLIELHEALQAFGTFRPASLDRPVGDDGAMTLGDLVADPHDPHAAVEARVVLATLLGNLGERDRTILHLRFVEELSQAQIGARLGVTQMQVSRLLERVLRTLRVRAGA